MLRNTDSIKEGLIPETMVLLGYDPEANDGVCFGVSGIMFQFMMKRMIQNFKSFILQLNELAQKYNNDQLKTVFNDANNRRLQLTERESQVLLKMFSSKIAQHSSTEKKEMNVFDLECHDKKFHTNHAKKYRTLLNERMALLLTQEENVIFKCYGLFDLITVLMVFENLRFSQLYSSERTRTQQKFVEHLCLAKVDFDEELKVVLIDQITDLFTQKPFTKMLTVIQAEIDACPTINHPIAFLVGSYDHCNVLSYDPLTKSWVLGGDEFLLFQEEVSVQEVTESLFSAHAPPDQLLTRHTKLMLNLKIFADERDALSAKEVFENVNSNKVWACYRSDILLRNRLVDVFNMDILRTMICERDNANASQLMARMSNFTRKPNQKELFMYTVCMQNESIFYQLLAMEGVQKGITDKYGYTELHYAARANRINFIKPLLAFHSINARTNLGKTPLLLAADLGYIRMVELLVDNGCDITIPSLQGLTPIRAACHKHGIEIIIFLLKKLTAAQEFANLFTSDWTFILSWQNKALLFRKLIDTSEFELIDKLIQQTLSSDVKLVVALFLQHAIELANVALITRLLYDYDISNITILNQTPSEFAKRKQQHTIVSLINDLQEIKQIRTKENTNPILPNVAPPAIPIKPKAPAGSPTKRKAPSSNSVSTPNSVQGMKRFSLLCSENLAPKAIRPTGSKRPKIDHSTVLR